MKAIASTRKSRAPKVRKLFLESKYELPCNGNVGPIFDLASPEHSLAAMLVGKIVCTLRMDSTHWNLLRLRQGAWGPELRKLILGLVLRLAAQLWYRLVRFYQLWPWRMARFLDDRRSPQQQRVAALELMRANTCCLDNGVSNVIAAEVKEVDELLATGMKRKLLQAMMMHTKTQTIPVEERFAAQA